MPSILLIRPLCAGDEPEFAEPLGIERLAGYMRAHGVLDVELADRRLPFAERDAQSGDAPGDEPGTSTPGFYEELGRRYPDGAAPDIVGLSLMTSSDVPDALRIVSRLQHRWPHTLFTAGGVYVSTAFDEAARAFPRHVLLQRGEGEQGLLALAREGGKRTSAEGPSPLEPFPPLAPDDWAIPHRPDLERYARLRCAVNMQTSRGCPGACTFCATPMLPPELRTWQPRSIPLVVDEMQSCAERLGQAGLPPIFNFVDDDFGSLTRLEELADELGRRGMRVAFACEMRLASLAGQPRLAERIEALHARGLTRVFVGVESLDPATLKRWRKPTRPLEELPGIMDAFRRAKVTLACGYILWHGRQDPTRALAEAKRLHELGIYSHRAALSRLIVFPGCEAFAKGTNAAGFERMDDAAEERYRVFAEAAQELTRTWMEAAIAEPYEEARAYLDGGTAAADPLRCAEQHAEIERIRTTLAQANEASYALFREVFA